jgi:hypothetical protein
LGIGIAQADDGGVALHRVGGYVPGALQLNQTNRRIGAGANDKLSKKQIRRVTGGVGGVIVAG